MYNIVSNIPKYSLFDPTLRGKDKVECFLNEVWHFSQDTGGPCIECSFSSFHFQFYTRIAFVSKLIKLRTETPVDQRIDHPKQHAEEISSYLPQHFLVMMYSLDMVDDRSGNAEANKTQE